MKTYLHHITLLAFTFLMAAAAPAAHALDMRKEIDPLAQAYIDNGDMVGCVVAVFKGDDSQVLTYGEAKKGSKQEPKADTIYEIGSATKAFTGTILAEMVDEGLVKLDDPVQKYLPKSVKMPVKGRPITLEDLATHTSGLPRLPDNMKPADPLNPYADYTVKQMCEFLNKHELRRAPGEYEYSNLGVGLLGNLLASQGHTSYEKLMIERIAKPLGMKDTCITLSAEQKKRLAPPYDASLEPGRNWDLPAFVGAGAIRSTAPDLVKFLQASLATDDKPITKAFKLAQTKRQPLKIGGGIGLNWHIAGDDITVWHNGMTGAYSSWISVVPQYKAGVVVLTNAPTSKTDELGELMTRAVCGIKVTPPKDMKKEKAIEVAADVLKKYAGYYALSPAFGLTVTVEDGKLMVQATDQPKFPVFAKSKTEFFYKVVDAQITFEPGKDGKVNKLVLHQNGADIPGERQKGK